MNNDDLPKTPTDEALDPKTSPMRLEKLAEYPPLQPLVAANPNTPVALLTRLSKAEERATRRAVAQNPNTAVETLCKLAAEFPAEFLQNPIVPMLNLIKPDFIMLLPLRAWQYILRDEQASRAWMQQVQRKSSSFSYRYTHSPILDLINVHVAVSKEVPSDWHKQASTQVQKHLLTEQAPIFEENTNESLLFTLLVLLIPQVVPMLKPIWEHFLYHNADQGLLLLAACHNLGAKTLAQMVQKSSLPLRCLIARHPQTPSRTLFALSFQLSSEVRCAVASNPHTPLPILHRLAMDSAPSVRRRVAYHQKLTAEDVQIMALDTEERVRAAIATRLRLDSALFEQLAQDQSPLVRAALAGNISIPVELLTSLARNDESEVRTAAAGNSRLPSKMQELLSSAPQEGIRARLARNTRLSESLFPLLLNDSSIQVRKALAANPRTPLPILEALWQNATPEVYQGLAHNLNTPASWLQKMAEEQNLPLLIALARHKYTPSKSLYTLALTQQPGIWQALASNPRISLELLELAVETTPLPLEPSSLELWIRILYHPSHPRQQALVKLLASCLQEFVESLKGLPVWFRHICWQYSSSFPPQIMEPLASSPHWEERYLVASHPRIGDELRSRMAHDGNCYVRAATRAHRK